MANVPRSSFIPKQVTPSAVPKQVRHTRVFSIVGFFAGAFLFLALALSAGVFIYKNVVDRELADKQATLSAERNKFNEADMAEVRAFNERIELARTLLDGHIVPSKVFEALENSTKQSVQYTNFDFTRRPSGDVTLALTGVTDAFAKVALQSLQNSEDFILKDMAVSEVGINVGGDDSGEFASAGQKSITFNLISNIPATKLLFEREGVSSEPDDEIPVTTETDEEDTDEEGDEEMDEASASTTVETVEPETDTDTETETGTSTEEAEM